MNTISILDKFSDGEIITYAEIIRRLPNHFAFREVLLDIPKRIISDDFRVMKLNNEIRLYIDDAYFIDYPYVEILFDTFDIDKITICEPNNSDLDPNGDY